MEALNKKKSGVKSAKNDKSLKTESNLNNVKIDAIKKQELDVTREQLDNLYSFAKTWTYEELYLHFLRFDQATIYQMKSSMEFFLRLQIPDDLKDLELKHDVSYVKLQEDDEHYKALSAKKAEKDASKLEEIKPPAQTASTTTTTTSTESGDVHIEMSVVENEEKVKKEKLGDEDKFFAKIAIRRQKLIARYQLPALYRYIHERLNNIPSPAPVSSIFRSQQTRGSKEELMMMQYMKQMEQSKQQNPQQPQQPRQPQQPQPNQHRLQQTQTNQQRSPPPTGQQRQPTPEEIKAMRLAAMEQQKRRTK